MGLVVEVVVGVGRGGTQGRLGDQAHKEPCFKTGL
jgi:hypothetical protein